MGEHEHPAECCFRCRFHRVKGSRCRRYPPVVVFDVNTLERVTMYPSTNQDMWCGEFAPIPDAP